MSRKTVRLLTLVLGVLAADQATKFAAVSALTTQMEGRQGLGERLRAFAEAPPSRSPFGLSYRPRGAVTVVPSLLRLRHAENRGAAWGMGSNLPEHVRRPFFHLVVLAAAALVLLSYRKLSLEDRAHRLALWGLPLVLGGALGNWADRLTRGFVVDFIQAHWFDRAYFPSFNVADVAINVGVGLLLLDGLRQRPAAGRQAERSAEQPPASSAPPPGG